MSTVTAIAQAVEALRSSARDHKRSAAAHRRAARENMQRAALLERLTQDGIKVIPEGGDTDGRSS